MPVATPPNAIVFGAGYLSVPEMARAGICLNLISVVLIAALSLVIVPLILGR
ncbi:MAG: anion permease [Candidatus Bipolaricaulia bacterium]